MTYKNESGYRYRDFYGHSGLDSAGMRAESYTRTMLGVKLQREIDEANWHIRFLRRARPVVWTLIALFCAGGAAAFVTGQWWWAAVVSVFVTLIFLWVLRAPKGIKVWEKHILEHEPKIREHHFESLKWLHRAEHREWEDEYDALLPLLPYKPWYLDEGHKDYTTNEGFRMRREQKERKDKLALEAKAKEYEYDDDKDEVIIYSANGKRIV